MDIVENLSIVKENIETAAKRAAGRQAILN